MRPALMKLWIKLKDIFIDLTSNRSSYKDVVPSYDDYVKLQKTKYRSFESKVDRWQEGQKRYILSEFSDINRNSKIVDIACGDGVGLREFKKLGFKDIAGVEFESEKAKIARKTGYKVFEDDMHNLVSLKDSQFDIVYSSHTVEHSYYPKKLMKEFRRILKKKGRLYVVLPYPDTEHGNDAAHGAKFELGTNKKDNGQSVIKFFKDNKFKLVDMKLDTFRQQEIWLILEK